MTGITYLDGIATVIIGLILGATAIWLAYETKELLIGESTNREVVHSLRDMTKQLWGVTHVNDVLTMQTGVYPGESECRFSRWSGIRSCRRMCRSTGCADQGQVFFCQTNICRR